MKMKPVYDNWHETHYYNAYRMISRDKDLRFQTSEFNKTTFQRFSAEQYISAQFMKYHLLLEYVYIETLYSVFLYFSYNVAYIFQYAFLRIC